MASINSATGAVKSEKLCPERTRTPNKPFEFAKYITKNLVLNRKSKCSNELPRFPLPPPARKNTLKFEFSNKKKANSVF